MAGYVKIYNFGMFYRHNKGDSEHKGYTKFTRVNKFHDSEYGEYKYYIIDESTNQYLRPAITKESARKYYNRFTRLQLPKKYRNKKVISLRNSLETIPEFTQDRDKDIENLILRAMLLQKVNLSYANKYEYLTINNNIEIRKILIDLAQEFATVLELNVKEVLEYLTEGIKNAVKEGRI